MIAQEVPAPIGTVFSEICQQQDLGVSLDTALRKACAATPSPDLKLFATSIVIQVRSGGNLADIAPLRRPITQAPPPSTPPRTSATAAPRPAAAAAAPAPAPGAAAAPPAEEAPPPGAFDEPPVGENIPF